jgi:hypothetical protein
VRERTTLRFLSIEMNEHHFAVCIHNAYYLASLELFKIYQVLPDDEATENGDI